jgi:hypothetical protein
MSDDKIISLTFKSDKFPKAVRIPLEVVENDEGEDMGYGMLFRADSMGYSWSQKFDATKGRVITTLKIETQIQHFLDNVEFFSGGGIHMPKELVGEMVHKYEPRLKVVEDIGLHEKYITIHMNDYHQKS